MPTPALNPAYLDGYPQGWSVQNVLGQGGGDESLVSGGSAPTTGIGGGGPAFYGLTAYAFDPARAIAGTTVLATGAQYVSKFFWPGGNMNFLWAWASAATVTSTHGWLAVYDTTGVLWAATADQTSTYLKPAGAQKIAVAGGPVPVPSGYYYGYASGVWSAGSPTFAGMMTGVGTPTGIVDEININTAGSWAFADNATTVSALPASLTFGTGWVVEPVTASTGIAMWFAVS